MKQVLQLIRPFREMRKIVAFSFALLAFLTIPMGMRGQTQSTYTKVTSEPSDWSGEYLLVYEDDNNAYVWTGIDNANCYESVTLDATITIPSGAVSLTIAPMNDGYSIMINGGTNNGKYIYGTSGSNKINFGNTANVNAISYESSSVKIVSNTSVMRFNSASDNMRFRYFKSASYASQKTVHLYKLDEAAGDDPSITANNVNIVYDATSGEIAYTLNNPATNGILSVSENVDWISNAVLNETEGKVNFTTTTNEENTAREGVITITYTYGENETVTKDVTVTQAAAPVIYDNIEDLFIAATSTATDVTVSFDSWFVTGVSTNGKNVFVTDGTNGFVIFDNGGGLGDTYHVDDLIEGTTTASLVLYTGFAELKNVDATNLTMTSYGAPAFSDVAMEELSGINTGALVHYENLTCSVYNNKYYLSDGTTTLQVYNALYAFGSALEANHVYNISGVYQQYNNTKEILPRSADDIEEVVSADPSITVADATVSVDAEGAEGTITVTYENITEVAAEVWFCDAAGTMDATYEWITADINDDNNVEYLVEPNEGDARTAYFKVWAYDDDWNEVYSNLVTVNQSEYVAPTFAELPFEFDGGKAAIENTDGLSQEGLGSDYNGGNNVTTPLKFDGTGDWLLLQFNERPGTLTFDITGNNFSGSTFTVQTSEDGVTYTDLETYTELGDTQNEEFTNLGENVRYIKWIYTNKSSGNVGLGNIALAEYVAPQPAITLNSYSIEAPAAETEGTLTVTYTEIETSMGVSIYWFESDGETSASEPDWISAEINTELNVEYLIEENEGAARTAYFKVYGVDADLNDVYSDLVTVTQAAMPQQYTLEVTSISNAEIIVFDATDPDETNWVNLFEGIDEVQVLEGTPIALSVSAAQGYVLETLMVNDVNHVADIEGGVYTFTMPAGNVTISATALVAPATEDYELFSGDLVEGDYLIVYDGKAMNNTVSSDRLQYEEVIATDDVIATGDATIVWHIAPSATEGYWTIYSADANAYAAGTGAKNKAQMLASGTDDKALWTVTSAGGTYEFLNKANFAANVNYYLRKNGTYGFACYGENTGGALSLYKKVVPSQYRISFVTNSAEIGELVASGNSSVSLPEASIEASGWEFAGWSQSFVLETTTEPALVTNPYMVTDNVVLYAVYKKEQSSSYTYNSHPSDVQIELNENNPSYTIDFETATAQTYWTEEKPAGWSLVWIEAPRRPSRRSQIVYEPVYARGDYYLRMDSLNIYAMPPIYAGEETYADISTLQMELYVRQPYASHQLQVGVLEESSEGTAVFVPVSTINNLTSALEYRTVDFSGYSGDGHRIAFKNVYSDGDHGLKSFNYIDDIRISRIADNTCGITELPYTNDFDELTSETGGRTGVSLECWTVAQKDNNFADTYAPQLYHAASYAHSGAYTLLLDGRCIYAMPEFKVEGKSIGDVELEFNVRQSSASCSLQVGVMSDLNDASTFVALDTISNNGFSGQQMHVVDFGQYASSIPEGAKYIAFRNVYDGTWGRSPHYIDDIKLAERMECGITELPYTQNFDTLTDITEERTGVQPECWTEVVRDANYAATYGPQLVHAASYAHSGSYTLLLDGRCIYAMPEFKVEGKSIGDVQMEFYVRQYSANCSLQVGVMSNLNDASSFVALETVSNGGASGQQMHVVDFGQYVNSISADAKYIAFRNVYSGTWGRSPQYLDDITLSIPEAKIAEVSSENEIDDMGVERYLEGIKVYPNPTRGNLYIDAMDVQKVECYNQMGQLVGVYDNANELNISELSNGVYMLRITVPQGVTMRKVVKR